MHLTIGNAREFLLVAGASYDLIASEPSNPYRAGVSSLYTRESYQAVQRRVAAGGIFTRESAYHAAKSPRAEAAARDLAEYRRHADKTFEEAAQ